MSNWIKHDGGACPVPPETVVRYRMDDGHERLPVRAGQIGVLRWRHITEYQHVDPTPSAAPARASVTRLPSHTGDGYSWGGGTILNIDEQAFPFGETEEARDIATKLAALWNAARNDGDQ